MSGIGCTRCGLSLNRDAPMRCSSQDMLGVLMTAEEAASHNASLACCDLDAEGVILSAVLMGSPGDVLGRLDAVGLKPAHFWADANRRVYEAAKWLQSEAAAVDVVSVANRLRETGKLLSVGGSPYLALLLNCQPATAHPEAHALTVIELWRRRAFLEIANRLSVQMRAGECDSEGAYTALRDYFREQRSGT